MAPVHNEGDLLGYVALIDEMDKIFEIAQELKGLGDTEESYLINKDLLLISPLTLKNFNIMVQSIDTENAVNCVEGIKMYGSDLEKLKEHGERSFVSFLDHRGVEVLGKHSHIEEINWCLLTEVDKKEVIDTPLRELIKKSVFFSLIGVFVFSLIGFFVGNYFGQKNKERKLRKYPCGVGEGFRPWYCRLYGANCHTYPNRKCGEVIKIRNFFINLKLGHLILIALIFAIGYFFLVKLIFDRIILPLIISGLLSFIVGFLIFSYGFRLKDSKSRKYLFSGAGAIIIYHLVHIPMEQYFNLVKPFNILYWVPSLILYIFGFLFLLKFLKDSVK